MFTAHNYIIGVSMGKAVDFCNCVENSRWDHWDRFGILHSRGQFGLLACAMPFSLGNEHRGGL